MANTETIGERPLRPGDMNDLVSLVEEAGWNQTNDDWLRMLALGSGHGRTSNGDRVIASAVTMPYAGRIGWIGMVLVSAVWRRRGLATQLLKKCIQELRSAGLISGLDATPAGQQVYEKLGFRGDLTITRWRRKAATHYRETGKIEDNKPENIEKLGGGDIDWMAELDAEAFGASRSKLLNSLLSGGSPSGWKVGKTAFLLRRPGRTATYLGPLCSRDTGAAERLILSALLELDGPLLMDVPDMHRGIARRLGAAGFAAERPFLRMYLDAAGRIGEPKLTYCIAGPELG